MRPVPVTVALALLLIATAPASALAEPGDLGIELSAGPVFVLEDSARASQEAPWMLLHVGADINPWRGLVLGIGGDIDVTDGDRDAHRAMARARYRVRVPLAWLFAGFGFGYQWKETRGSDWVFNDDGFAFQADAGATLFPLPWLGATISVSYAGYDSDAHERNSSYAPVVHQLFLGVDAVARF